MANNRTNHIGFINYDTDSPETELLSNDPRHNASKLWPTLKHKIMECPNYSQDHLFMMQILTTQNQIPAENALLIVSQLSPREVCTLNYPEITNDIIISLRPFPFKIELLSKIVERAYHYDNINCKKTILNRTLIQALHQASWLTSQASLDKFENFRAQTGAGDLDTLDRFNLYFVTYSIDINDCALTHIDADFLSVPLTSVNPIQREAFIRFYNAELNINLSTFQHTWFRTKKHIDVFGIMLQHRKLKKNCANDALKIIKHEDEEGLEILSKMYSNPTEQDNIKQLLYKLQDIIISIRLSEPDQHRQGLFEDSPTTLKIAIQLRNKLYKSKSIAQTFSQESYTNISAAHNPNNEPIDKALEKLIAEATRMLDPNYHQSYLSMYCCCKP